MNLPEVLETKDGSLFRTQQIRVKYEHGKSGKNPNFYIERYGPELNFTEMGKNRKETDSEEMRENLLKRGHIFANLGISLNLTTTLYDEHGKPKHYLVLVRQRRPDMDEGEIPWVAKHISGYLDLGGLSAPEQALANEVAEELIIQCGDGKVLRGTYMGQALPERYAKSPANLEYRTNPRFQIFECPSPLQVSRMMQTGVFLSGRQITARTPKVLAHTPTNSLNLIYSGHLDIPSIPQVGTNIAHAEIPLIVGSNATTAHAEDGFNLKTKMLEVKPVEQGVFLLGLNEQGKLDRSVKNFLDGNLVDWTEGIVLTEALAKPEHPNIVNKRNVSLEEVLSTQ